MKHTSSQRSAGVAWVTTWLLTVLLASGGAFAQAPRTNEETPRRPRNMNEYAAQKAREAEAAAATQPAGRRSSLHAALAQGEETEAAATDDAEADADSAGVEDAPSGVETPPTQIRRDADDIQTISEEELAEIEAMIRAEQEARSETSPAEDIRGPAWTGHGESWDNRPAEVSVPPSQRSRRGQGPQTQPAATGETALPEADVQTGVAFDPATGQFSFQKSKWYLVPPEDRPYFFSWNKTPFEKVVEDLEEMTSLSMVGMHMIQPNTVGVITLRSPHLMGFDEALTFLNKVLFDKNVWIVRRDDYMVIRNLTEWYQRIPPRLVFTTQDEYEQAKLPSWEVATVYYKPKHRSSGSMIQAVMDTIPLNALRATMVPESSMIELTGFVYFIDERLEYLTKIDTERPKIRYWEEYEIEHVTPEEAADLLLTLTDEGSDTSPGPPGTPPTARRRSPRGQPQPSPAEVVGESDEDLIDIKTVPNRNSLLIRASAVKHQEIKEVLDEFIKPSEVPTGGELIFLEHADPQKLVEIVKPLLGEKQEYQPPAPPSKPNEPPKPAPPVQIRTVGTTAELIPVPEQNAILVKANKKEMAQIRAYVEMLDVPVGESPFEIVELEHATAASVANILRTVIGSQPARMPTRRGGMTTGGGFNAVADTVNDKLLVLQGSPSELEEARTLIQQLDVDPMAGAIQQLVTLENVDPAMMSQILSQRYGTQARSRWSISTTPTLPNFIPDDNSSTLIVLCRREAWPEIERLIKDLDERAVVVDRVQLYPLEHIDVNDVLPILSQTMGDMSTARALRGPIRSYLQGPEFIALEQTNTLLVSADEKTHAKVEKLLGQLDVSGAGKDDFRPIELQKADAEYVAQKIEELFSSGRSTYNPYARSRYYGGGSSGGAQVRVIAEPVTNRVLVAASDKDFARAEELAGAIDAEYIKNEYERKLFTLEFAQPMEVEQAIQQVFNDRQSGGSSRYGRGVYSASTSAAPPAVRTVATDTGVIVMAAKDKLEEIEAFIAEIDTNQMGGNELRTYQFESTDYYGTSRIASNLQSMFGVQGRGGAASNIRFMGDYGSDILMVSAPRSRMEEIDRMVREMMETKKGEPVVMRHFNLKEADPETLAPVIENVLQEHYQAKHGTYRRYTGGGGMEPSVIAHTSGRRIMVTADESMMELAEQLIEEFDRAAEDAITQIVQLEKSKAAEIAPVIEAQISDSSGSSPYDRFSSRRYRFGYSGYGRSTTTVGSKVEFTATPVESSNSIILKGPEEKVFEARALVKLLDGNARPDGPMVEVFQLQHAELYDVVSFVQDMLGVGGYSDYSYSGSGSGSGAGRSGTGGRVVIRPEYSGKKIIVSAPYEKMPQIAHLIDLKEREAELDKLHQPDDKLGQGIVRRDGKYITKAYDLPQKVEAVDEVAKRLRTILEKYWGTWDAPWVTSFPMAHQILVEGTPEQFPEVEKWLDKILEDPPKPRLVYHVVKVPEGVRASELAMQIRNIASPSLQGGLNVNEIPRSESAQQALDALQNREIRWDSGLRDETLPASNPYVPPAGMMAEMQKTLAGLSWVQAAEVSATQPEATRPATATQPSSTAERSSATQPAEVDRTDAEPTVRPLGPETGDVDEAAPLPEATVADDVLTPHAPVRAEDLPRPGERPQDRERQSQDMLREAMERALDQTQIVVDDEKGLIYFFGRGQEQIRGLDLLLEDLIERTKDILDTETDDRPIRVFTVRHIDVAVAANILEQMFNEQPVRGARPQQQQPRGARAQQRDREDDEEEGRSRRREEEEEEQQRRQAEEQARLTGQRIKVLPDPRTQTLIIKADADMFPKIAELLLKIDRKGEGPPVDIKIFRLKKLNAYEVEQTLKAILKIEDRQRTSRLRRPRGAGASASDTADMIEQMQEQMLELQQLQQQVAAGPDGEGQDALGGPKLNPSKDISITSDSTTNTVIVQAPEQGMVLVEKLINDLEEQEIPIRIETFLLKNAPAEKVASELEKIFQAQRGPRGGGEGIDPSRIGDVKFAADARTNTIVVRALDPDLEKIRPLVEEFDKAPELGEQVQLYPVQHADVRDMAQTLTTIFAEEADTGPLAVRITADANTNTLVVRAPEAKQLIIAHKIREIDEGAATRFTPRQVQLTLAGASEVAAKLTEIFAGRNAGALRRQISITGDDNSKILFVSAPDEVFKDIERVAMQLDQSVDMDFRVYPLKHAFAEEIHARFREMMTQLLGQMRGAGDMNVAVTPDPRTNSLIVSGSPKVFLLVEKVLADLDVQPEGFSEVTTSMFYLTKADATSLATTIDQLYSRAKFPGGVDPPRAVAVPTSNLLYVYGTKQQIQNIKANVIDRYEEAMAEEDILVEDYVIPVERADVEDVAQRLSNWFERRFANMRTAGGTKLHPSQTAVSIIADPSTKSLLVSATEENKKQIDKMLAEFDTAEDLNPPEMIRLEHARASDVESTLNNMIRRSMTIDRSTRQYPVTVEANNATNTLVLAGRERERNQVKELIKQLDIPQPADERLVQRYPLQYADIGSVNTAIMARFSDNATRPIQDQITVTPDYTSNTLIVTASDENHARVETIVTDLDQANVYGTPVIRTIKIQNARASDLSTTMNDMIRRTKRVDRITRMYPISVTPDDSTNTLVVTATPEEMEWAEKLITDLDVEPESVDDRQVRPYPLQYADLGSVQTAINARFADKQKRPVQEQVSITADSVNNTLLITASETNHQKITEIIEDLDTSRLTRMRPPVTIKLEHVRASDLERTLTQMIRTSKRPDRRTRMYPVTVTANDAANSLLVTAATDSDMEEIRTLIEELDQPLEEDDTRQIVPYDLKYVDVSSVVNIVKERFKNTQQLSTEQQVEVVPVHATNMVVVTASAENHERIRRLIEDVDSTGVGTRKNYPIALENADANEVARALTSIYNNAMPRSRTGRVPAVFTAAPGSSQVVVTCEESELEEIKLLIDELDGKAGVDPEREMRVIAVRNVAATEMADFLTQYLLPSGARRGAALPGDTKIVASTGSDAVVISGPRERLDELEQLATQIEEQAVKAGDEGVREVRVFTLDNADPRTLASAIQNSFGRRGRNVPEIDQVDAIGDTTTGTVIVTSAAAKFERIEKTIRELDQESSNIPQQQVIPLQFAQADELAQVLTQTYRYSSRRAGSPPISVQADTNGNNLIVSAGEADIRGMRDLVATLDQPPQIDVEELRVIPLQYIDAEETLGIMQEYLRKPTARVRRGGTDLIGNIRLQASSTLNALIVSGKAEEIDSVEAKIKTIDVEMPNASNAPKIIKLEHAVAAQLASTLTQMFTDPAQRARRSDPESIPIIMADDATNALIVRARTVDYGLIEDMASRLDVEGDGLGGLEIIRLTRGVDVERLAREIEQTINRGQAHLARQKPGMRAGQISIGVDTRAPALIVAGSPELFPTVQRLVAELQDIPPDSSMGARVVPIRNIPARDMQRAMNEMLKRQGIDVGR